MKALILSLALAASANAAIVGPTTVQEPNVGAPWPLSGALTYALNNALTGTASTAIDLSTGTGVMVTLTSTGSSLVTIYFSNANVAGASALSSYQVTSPGTYYIPATARYLSFINSGSIPTARVSAFYYLAVPSVTSSGSSTVTGNVSITASVPLTVTSSIVSNLSSFVSVSTAAYAVLSQTATVLNLTNVAAVGGGTGNGTGPCLICLTSNGGAAAGFKVQFGTSATAPGNLTASSVGHYVAASTTSQCWGPFKAGGHAYLAGVAASSSVIFDIQQAQ